MPFWRNERTPLVELDLRLHAVQWSEDDDDMNASTCRSIELACGESLLQLMANSEEDAQQWMQALLVTSSCMYQQLPMFSHKEISVLAPNGQQILLPIVLG